ncbi:methyltransferase, FkbM family [Palleronia pelagia]|uniref:Methyltransferase, FkbM family n=2 Tax=Palleronia pelagia TaxID=387096 RepID=A0A1H8D2Y5_9RHOB|nr:methyltransferase, FkbM family [Palleronia pelagia]
MIGNEPKEFIRLLQGHEVSSVCFDTKCGPVFVPANSRSIIESFIKGHYYGSEIVDNFLGFETGSDRIVNVGANVGTTARLIAHSGKYQRIDCFEPHPQNFSLLQVNLLGYEGMSAHMAAVGSEEGKLPLNINPMSVGRHSFKTDFGQGFIDVPVATLDDFLEGDELFDLFIDVEGWEIEVLRGGERSLGRCNLCAIEWNAQSHTIEERKELLDLLRRSGFTRAVNLTDPKKDFQIEDIAKPLRQLDIALLRD